MFLIGCILARAVLTPATAHLSSIWMRFFGIQNWNFDFKKAYSSFQNWISCVDVLPRETLNPGLTLGTAHTRWQRAGWKPTVGRPTREGRGCLHMIFR